MAIELIAKVAPKNDGFVGMVDADQVLGTGDGGGTLPDDAVASSNVTQHEGDLDHTGIQNIGTNTHAQIDSHIGLHDNYAKFYNGAVLETIAISVDWASPNIVFHLAPAAGSDLTFYFGEAEYVDSSGDMTINIAAGATDTVPVEAFVWVYLDGSTPTMNTGTDWPATPYCPIARVLCQSGASLDTDAPLKVHAYTDHLENETENGHLQHINRKIRTLAAGWESGVAASDIVTDNITTSSGVVYQMHPGTMPAFDTSAGDDLYVVNNTSTPWEKVSDFSGVDTLADGTPMTNNQYVNLVLWGCRSENQDECKLFVNVPTAGYVTSALAEADGDGTTVYTIPAAFTGTGFLIAQYVTQYKTTGDTHTQSSKSDLRGLTPSTSPAGSGAFVPTSRLINTTAPITGGGDLSADRTLVLDGTVLVDTDFGANGLCTRTASGTYTNRTITGSTGITVANGDGVSGNPTLSVPAKNRTEHGILYCEDPAAGEAFALTFLPHAVTMVEVHGVTDTGTVTFNIERRAKTTPDQVGTDVIDSGTAEDPDLLVDATGETTTTFAASGAVAADQWLVLTITGVASSPTEVWISWEATID